MTTPIPDEQRDQVVELARAGRARNEIAREVGISTASVSRICADAGVGFDRSLTAAALQARVIDLKAARIGLATDLLDDVTVARGRMHVTEDARSFADMAKAVAALASTHVRLIAVDKDDATGTEAAKSMLGQLAAALGVAAAEDVEEVAGDGSV
ncbi:helix-turn-helix domain-containing protein [Streptomyces sp. ISL-112]|uniref:helix-turn-helix domain-containing protein n=1 Tax=unclassified Streptomyces TaxID=2593676 RepID=UPI001BEC03A4|nr:MULTISPECIES: helix-turn-helix domain-containing protein [unclassified Streptomyces]MBT2425225.1 helix-turn-helix domain-containing protein [Streptomyces sp. ISL-112]MBT2462016.1 helix-turn-helix domain-containing protein [Streptomyces sp. ISL-63]